MITKPKYFSLEELVCPHLFFKFGETAWTFFDQKHLVNIDFLRSRLGAISANNWNADYRSSDYIKALEKQIRACRPVNISQLPEESEGMLDERGLRCNQCKLVRQKSQAGSIYCSPHFTGQATDFDVHGMTSEEVRKWIISNQNEMPYNLRLENKVSWVHMDSRDTDRKITLFNA